MITIPFSITEYLSGLGTTVFIIVISSALGAVLGTAVYFWYYSESKLSKIFTGIYLFILKFVPPATIIVLVFYLIFFGRIKLNMFACITALTITFSYRMFNSIRNSVSAIDPGEKDAAVSMGYSRFLALKKLYLPAALPGILDALNIEIVFHIMDSAIVEVISVMDLQGVCDSFAEQSGDAWLPLLLASGTYIIIGFICSKTFKQLSEKLGKKKTEAQIRMRIEKGNI